MKLHHLDRDSLGSRPRAPDVVDVDRGRDGELPRSTRHVRDDVDEEDLEHAGHAPRAEIASNVTVEVQRVRVTLAREEAVEHVRPHPRREWEHRERRLDVRDMHRKTRKEATRHLGVGVERVRQRGRAGHVARGIEPGASVVVGRPQLVRLERLRHCTHREDVRRVEDLPHNRQRGVDDRTQVQRLARRHTRLRGRDDARPRRVVDAALVILEESVPPYTIRVKSDLEAPSQPLLHKLGMLLLYKAELHGPPHILDEGLVLYADSRQRAGTEIMDDTCPCEHLGELARHVRLFMPALRQAVHIGARAPVERHRRRAESRSQLT